MNALDFVACCIGYTVMVSLAFCVLSTIAVAIAAKIHDPIEDDYWQDEIINLDRPFSQLEDCEIIQDIDQATTDMFNPRTDAEQRRSATVVRRQLNEELGRRQKIRRK